MLVTKKRGEFIDLLRNFGVLQGITGLRVAYPIVRIKNKLESIKRELDSMVKPSPEWEKLDQERDAMAQSYARKDPLGKPVIIQRNGIAEYEMSAEDQKTFDEAYEKLKAEHAGVFEAREAQKERAKAFVDEVVTIEFYDLKKENLPDDLTVQQLSIIEPFVDGLDD